MHDKQSLCILRGCSFRTVRSQAGLAAAVIRRFLFDMGRRAHFCAYPVRAGRKSPGAGAIS
ncbi:hypothetical protein HMPREF9555_02158 [Selenomonas artemidis F0399]|uniref:Uncharacterized protein n=1 Tax=Selenomonas artemidis F0399 TaxID=749551 RepID=E7N563_9FIRM|nr:hypothetical protein HMPREF9555_02158 [Selenomonas artemidis F0399]